MGVNVDHRGGLTFWHWLGGSALAALAVLVARQAWADIAHIASFDEESSHVWLVPFMVVWLIWVRRKRLRACAADGRWVGTLVLALGWLLWSVGYHYEVQSFWHGGAVVMAAGGLLTVVGKDVFLGLLPAFAVLAFLVPVPGTGRQLIALPLQRATAYVTQAVAEAVGMTVSRQGNLLNIKGTEVAIAEACNGMRLVFTLFLACYVFAFVTPLRAYVRVLILALTPLTAVVCNVIRLVPTIWMYGNASREAAATFHDVSGWVMLVLAFLGLMGIVRVLRWAMVPVTPFHLASAA